MVQAQPSKPCLLSSLQPQLPTSHSDDEIQPDPIRSDQGTSTPTRATNRFSTNSPTPPTSGINRIRRILPVIQGTFAAIE